MSQQYHVIVTAEQHAVVNADTAAEAKSLALKWIYDCEEGQEWSAAIEAPRRSANDIDWIKDQ